MFELLKSLEHLSKQKKLQPAEEIISSCVKDFERIITGSIEEKEFDEIETKLMDLLSINNGKLSMQLCGRLGLCFSHLYTLKKSTNINNFVNFVINHINQATIYTLGFIIRNTRLDSYELFPKLIEKIVSQRNLVNPSLFTLSMCFKVIGDELESMAQKCYEFAIYNFSNDEVTQLFSIRLIKQLYKTKKIDSSVVLQRVSFELEKAKYDTVKEKIASFIAYILSCKISDEQTLRDALNEAKKSRESHLIYQYLLPQIDNSLLQTNAQAIIDFIIANDLSVAQLFVSLLNNETKKKLFDKLEKDSNTYDSLKVCQLLSYCEESDRKCSAIAMQIITTNPNERDKAIQFYKDLTESNHELAEEVLQLCCVFIAYPPESQPNLVNHMIGMSMIAAVILEADCSLFDKHKDNIMKCQSVGFKKIGILDGSLISAFLVGRAGILVDVKEVKNAICMALVYFTTRARTNPEMEQLYLSVVSAFFMKFKNDDISERFINILAVYDSLPAAAKMFSAVTPQMEDSYIFNFMNKYALSFDVPIEYQRTLIRHHYPAEGNFLTQKEPELPVNSIQISLTKYEISQLVLESYDSLLLNSPDECKNTSFLFGEKLHLAHILVLARNHKTVNFLPKETLQTMLDFIKKKDSIVQIEMAAEIISYLVNNEKLLDDVLNYIKGYNDTKKSILYKSLFTQGALSDAQIQRMMNELNSIVAKQNESFPFAMFSLSILFKCCPMQSLLLHLTLLECSFLLSVINMPIILYPINYYIASLCFTAMLPILSQENDPTHATTVSNIIHAFEQTKTSHNSTIYNNMIDQALVFRKNISIDPNVHFSTNKNDLLAINSSCTAFIDIMNIHNDNDYFEYVQAALWSLQVDKFSTAAGFIEKSSSISTNVDKWIELFKCCLTSGVLPGTTISSNSAVKCALLKAMKHTLKLIKEDEQMNNDALNEIVTALTTTIKNMKQSFVLSECFKRLVDFVELFKDIKNDADKSIVLSYDSQIVSAVSVAFKNINIGYELIHSYISFIEEIDSLSETRIGLLVKGLNACNKTRQAVIIAAELIDKASNSESINELMKNYAQNFAAIVTEAMKIFKNEKEEWKDLSKFRSEFSKSFVNIIKSFVYIESKEDIQPIPPKEFLDFIVADMQRTDEQWRVKAETSGFNLMFSLFVDETLEVIDNLLKSRETEEFGLKLITCIDKVVSIKPKDEGKFISFANMIINYADEEGVNEFMIQIIKETAELTKSSNEDISKDANQVLTQFYKDHESLTKTALGDKLHEYTHALENKETE